MVRFTVLPLCVPVFEDSLFSLPRLVVTILMTHLLAKIWHGIKYLDCCEAETGPNIYIILERNLRRYPMLYELNISVNLKSKLFYREQEVIVFGIRFLAIWRKRSFRASDSQLLPSMHLLNWLPRCVCLMTLHTMGNWLPYMRKPKPAENFSVPVNPAAAEVSSSSVNQHRTFPLT